MEGGYSGRAPWPVSINLAARLKCYRHRGP